MKSHEPKSSRVILTLLIASMMLTLIVTGNDDQKPARKPAGSTLRVVNDNLVEVDDGDCRGCLYAVKGSVYNPNRDGVKNVVIIRNAGPVFFAGDGWRYNSA